VLRPQTTLKLSFRLPPTLAPSRAAAVIQRTLERDPPYGTRVSFKVESAMGGWNAPALAPWLERSMQAASRISSAATRCTWHGRQHSVHGHAR